MKSAFLLLLFLSIQNALGAVAIINKIYKNRMDASAVISPNYRAQIGDFFVAKFQGGNTCYLEILKLKDNLALVDLSICSMKDFIRVGQKLGDSANKDKDVDVVSIKEESFAKLAEKEDFWKDIIPDKKVYGFSVFLLYSFADSIDFSGTTPNEISGAKNLIEGSVDSTGAAGIGFDYLFSKENHFGWDFNASLEFPRNFDYLEANTIGADFAGTVPDTSLWLGSLALNLNFTFPKTYIPYLGINFSLPIVSGGNLKVSSQIGVQAGLSKVFGEHLIADVEYRWLNFRGGVSVQNEVVQFTSAQFYGFLLRLKYLFK